MQFLTIPFAITLLFLTRRKLTIELGKLVQRFGGRDKTFAIVWSIIFLPGTIAHEMSHFFAAAFTGTRIGNVRIFPTLPRAGIGQEETSKDIHLGSVETQQLGLFRGFFVGTAPFLVGLALMIWLSSTFSNVSLSFDDLPFTFYDFLKLYLFFNIANSLFLSWVDFKHALPLIVILLLLGGIVYTIGVQPTIAPNSLVLELAAQLKMALLMSVGINVVVTFSLWTINAILKRSVL